MNHIKQVLTSRNRKSDDLTHSQAESTTDAAQAHGPTPGTLGGEGSHLASASQSKASGAQTDSSEHPIYDQFTGQSPPPSAGLPTKTTDQAPHFSNSPNLPLSPTSPTDKAAATRAAQQAASSLSPSSADSRPQASAEDASTASIKSGVLGFPQGDSLSDRHAALEGNYPERQIDATEHGSGGLPDRTRATEQIPHTGRDAALGAGALGATGLGGYEYAKHGHQEGAPQSAHDHASQPIESSTGRSFPLSGGVTSDPDRVYQTARDRPADELNERAAGTKDREAGLGDSREGLAGAASAAAASTVVPHSEHAQRDPATADHSSVTSSAADPHHHGGHGHTYVGDPCETDKKQGEPMFIKGPHTTDTANRTDPHLHVPGEFPDPTPIEESSEPQYERGTTGTRTAPSSATQPDYGRDTALAGAGFAAAQSPREDQRAEQPSEEHHYGRDAALVGGAGAVGLGAYEAGKHHQREATESDPLSGASPYSSSKLDPRVNARPSGLEEQKFDPTKSSKQHHSHDAALSGAGLTGAGSAGRDANLDHQTSQDPAHSRVVPSTNQPLSETQNQSRQPENHYGRDAAIAGTGVAGAGALYESQQRKQPDTGPASSTIGPHKSDFANIIDPRVQPDPAQQKYHQAQSTPEDPASKTVGPHKSNLANIVDPRVQPEPEKMKGHATTGPHHSDTLNRFDRKGEQVTPESQHHYGRDAAIAGGTGVAGYDVYEAAEKYDSHRSTQPSAALADQRYDPSAPGAHDPVKSPQHHYGRDAALAGGAGAAGLGAYEATKPHGTEASRQLQQHESVPNQAQQPSQTQRDQNPPQAQHHYGRDAAVVGGVGATGAGAYELSKHHHDNDATRQAQSSQQYPQPNQNQIYPDPQQSQHHYGRDAAVAGGVGAAGVGAYAAAKHHEDPSRQTQQVQPLNQTPTQSQVTQPITGHQRYDSAAQDPKDAQQQQQQQHHYGRDAAAAGGVGALAAGGYEEHKKKQQELLDKQQKDFEKKQYELEKQREKEQKHQSKLAAAEDKHHHKEMEKEQARHAKEVKKEEKKEEKEEEKSEKKHHLFGFLHRDKKDKSPEESQSSSPRHSKEYTTAASAAGGAGAAAAIEHEHHDGRNRLHKDPPPGHPAREAMEHPERYGGVAGTGKHEHYGTDGPIGRPDQISGDRETSAGVYGAHAPGEEEGTVIEPHTGLPMNVEKYGQGQGGTDASQTVEGYHQGHGGQGQYSSGATTNWDAIKKANTPY